MHHKDNRLQLQLDNIQNPSDAKLALPNNRVDVPCVFGRARQVNSNGGELQRIARPMGERDEASGAHKHSPGLRRGEQAQRLGCDHARRRDRV